MLFHTDGGVKFVCKLDQAKSGASTGKMSAMERFKQLDKKGTDSGKGSNDLQTKHKNAILQVSIHNLSSFRAGR